MYVLIVQERERERERERNILRNIVTEQEWSFR